MDVSNLHISDDGYNVYERLSSYRRNPSAFHVNLLGDVKLYVQALKFKMRDLIDLFASIFHRETPENKIKFANEIMFCTSPIDIDDQIKNELLDLLTWGPTAAISCMKIKPELSSEHQEYAEYQKEILKFRHDMVPIDKNYDAPHVLLSLCMDEQRYFAKYFNGFRWCRIQLHEHVGHSIPYLSANKYAVVNDDLWYVETDNFITKINLFHEEPIRSFYLPHPKPRDYQVCSDDQDVICISRNKFVSEVVPKPFRHDPHELTDWYQLRPHEYKTINNDDMMVYDVTTRNLSKRMKVCFQDSTDQLIELIELNDSCACCEYNIEPRQVMFNKTVVNDGYLRYRIPRDSRENCKYILVKTQTIVNFLNLFLNDSDDGAQNRKRKIH